MRRAAAWHIAALALLVSCHRPQFITLPSSERASVESRFAAHFGRPVRIHPQLENGTLGAGIPDSVLLAMPIDAQSALLDSMATWLYAELRRPRRIRAIVIGVELTDHNSTGVIWQPKRLRSLKSHPGVDTLPPAARDSVLDAVVDEFAVSNYFRSPSVAQRTYLSPYREFGLNDTLALHDSVWVDRVRTRYSLAGVCAGSASRRCPQRDSQTILAVSAPMVMPNGLVLVTTYRYSETGHSWGAATTPVYLTRLRGEWNVLCHGVSLYDDGSR